VQDYAIFTLDPAGRVTSWNDGARRLKGYTAAEILGHPVEQFYTPEDVAAGKPTHEMQTALREGRSEDESWRVRQDGSRLWVNEIMTPLYADDGTHLGFTKVSRDLTARKQAEDDRARALAAAQAARAEAEAALQTREQFLSIASHELRTPLTSLLGYASLLPQAVARGTGQVDKMTQRIVHQTQRLNRLIDQLLDVSRLQRGQFVLDRRAVDVAALVGQVVDEVRATLPPHSAHIVEVTAPDDPLVVDGDAERLEQVLHNLLSNALKYSPQGGRVQVAIHPTATEAVVAITDQGIGIPAAAQIRLFEAFYRAPNVGGQASGFGLGLHIVREIVARHGGRIEVESTEGVGSTFRVVLPLQARGGTGVAGASNPAA
jgi:PAS domain S-box-containing protein